MWQKTCFILASSHCERHGSGCSKFWQLYVSCHWTVIALAEIFFSLFMICLGFWNFCLFWNIWELFQTGAFPGVFSIRNFNLHHFKVDGKAPIVGTFIAWDPLSFQQWLWGGARAVKSPTVCDPLHSTARVELIQRAALSDLWHNSNLCPPPRDSPCAVATSFSSSFSSFLWEGLVFRCRDDNWDGEEEGRDGRTLGGYITTEKESDLWRLLTSPSQHGSWRGHLSLWNMLRSNKFRRFSLTDKYFWWGCKNKEAVKRQSHGIV